MKVFYHYPTHQQPDMYVIAGHWRVSGCSLNGFFLTQVKQNCGKTGNNNSLKSLTGRWMEEELRGQRWVVFIEELIKQATSGPPHWSAELG